MPNRELLVRLAATPIAEMSHDELRLLMDWLTHASPESRDDLLAESARVHTEIRRRGLR